MGQPFKPEWDTCWDFAKKGSNQDGSGYGGGQSAWGSSWDFNMAAPRYDAAPPWMYPRAVAQHDRLIEAMSSSGPFSSGVVPDAYTATAKPVLRPSMVPSEAYLAKAFEKRLAERKDNDIPVPPQPTREY